ncbi:MAG: PA14 domain-containing protein [Verrucomicrobiota bacterium]
MNRRLTSLAGGNGFSVLLSVGTATLFGLLAAPVLTAQESGAQESGAEASPQEEGAAPPAVAPAAPEQLPSALILASPDQAATGVSYERWTGWPGEKVAGVRAAVMASGKAPAMSGVAPSLSFPKNDGKNYLARVRGFIMPDRAGTARFVLSSEDNSELWLSPDDSPFSRRRAAWIIGTGLNGNTAPGQTNRFTSQWSSPVRLVPGHRYFFEIWHKQGEGNDHLTLSWQYEGDKAVSSIPASVLRPYAPPVTDDNDDGLPDQWQSETGLAALDNPADRGSWGDPDGDGVLNIDEYAAQTNPMDAEPVTGVLLWERWHGIAGSEVTSLVHNPRFTGEPDDALFVSGGATPVLATGLHGSRLSGFLVPEASGDYQLAVAGDDAVELWVSDDDSCSRKERLAFGTSPTPRDNWNVVPCQRTRLLSLEAGQLYYFEILQKNERGVGWSALAWKKPADKEFTTVPASMLRSPGRLVGDARRDFLPADWVAQTLAAMDSKVREKSVITQFGDPDGDGIPNWLEAKLNTDPFERSQVLETWIREWWHKQRKGRKRVKHAEKA